MTARLTALRRARPGRIALEVDGRHWRTVPDEVVVACGLACGLELDRPLLRRLRGELRRAEALSRAGRALARGDLSAKRLDERLERAGVHPAIAEATVERLSRGGLVDDARLARRRAASLAESWGDEAIAARLRRDGIAERDVREALDALPPERERAQALARGEHDARRAARLLARRGFGFDAIEEAVGFVDDPVSPSVGGRLDEAV